MMRFICKFFLVLAHGLSLVFVYFMGGPRPFLFPLAQSLDTAALYETSRSEWISDAEGREGVAEA